MEVAETPLKTKKVLRLFFTGFGKFGNVLENPTTHHSRKIETLLRESGIDGVELHSTRTITVAIEYCDEALSEIYSKINELIAQEAKEPHVVEYYYVVLHTGVWQGSGRISIEQVGKNIKSFRIPDENGNQPLDCCIDEGKEKNSWNVTNLNVEGIAKKLIEKGHTAAKNTNAGEYICNYTYYCSLKTRQEVTICPERVYTLFCHVPTFEEISEE
jgi:pyrrolidone-carboxylate peptidase